MSTLDRAVADRVHILIAEDSPTQAERLRYTLEQNGYRVTVTNNGRQALETERLHTPDRRPAKAVAACP